MGKGAGRLIKNVSMKMKLMITGEGWLPMNFDKIIGKIFR